MTTINFLRKTEHLSSILNRAKFQSYRRTNSVVSLLLIGCFSINREYVTASSDGSLKTLLDVEEPAEWEYCSGLASIATSPFCLFTPYKGEVLSRAAVG